MSLKTDTSSASPKFDSFSSAFDYCREADTPVTVIIAGEKWKLYPSGRAEEKGEAILYAKIRLTEEIERAIPLSGGWNNKWSEGTEFFVRQNRPGEGMVVVGGVDAGIGIPPEAVIIIKTFDSFGTMLTELKRGSHE